MKKLNYSAIIEKSDHGWHVTQLQEIPKAIMQVKIFEELKQNLLSALVLVIDFHRDQTNILCQGPKIIKQKLNLA
jgi:predicted RNase H-like HicB family nuclease